MSKFLINGPVCLKGTVKASGSKNAALPIISASVLNKGITILKNIPDISDIRTLIKILEFLNIKTEFNNNILKIDASKIENKSIPLSYVNKLRGAIVLLGSLLARTGEVKMAFPGGCVIGKRPIDSHLSAFENMGCEIIQNNNYIHIKKKKNMDSRYCLKEMSVTATENAISYASGINQKTEISLCAAEPHVQDLCGFLKKLGSKISGIGTHNLKIEGLKSINKNVEYRITSDYLEVGTFAVGAAITGGHVIIDGVEENQLDSFLLKMKEAGVKFEYKGRQLEIFPSNNLKAVDIKTGVFPAFATDLQAPFSLIQFKAKGVSKIFETLFEKRFNYLFEIEKMGAQFEWLSQFRAIIIGGKELIGTEISSCDLRAGAAMVLAALIAKGKTEVLNVNYIDRGYENFEQKLRNLGVDIQRIES